MHDQGMRSGIECSLCMRCPRDQVQGCCVIGPVFLLTDIGHFINNGSDDFVIKLLDSPYTDLSEHQFRVRAVVRADNRTVCRFHHPEIGCRIPLAYRNTVCRQFLCPEVRLWQDRRARRWVQFWLRLQEEEIRCQQLLAAECARKGCSLLVRRQECLQLIGEQYRSLVFDLPEGYPQAECIMLDRQERECPVLIK